MILLNMSSAVSYLLETNQRQQAQEYIQDYVEALNDTHSYIQGEHSHVASVVHQSKNQAHTWGIPYECSIRFTVITAAFKAP